MANNFLPEISITGARTNNLKNVSLCIPHNKLVVVTGKSGSGKSSLVYDVLAKEGQRRYFETLPSFARLYAGKLNKPDVDEITGLSPVIVIGQSTAGMHARSTVGTISDLYDLLRLLFARCGKTDQEVELSRALFSFNSTVGKCQKCNGIGKEEEIDLKRLIVNPDSSIREGALAPTLPNGYIMYSQVTIDVLNQVCEAEGFSVDIPWNELKDEEQQVILYGSNKIKVPFGKHSLESRLKWTGIKAKPREDGFYKGMIPIMSDILKRDRNANILKYVHAITCNNCKGTRLNEDALKVEVQHKNIAALSKMEIAELDSWITSKDWNLIELEIVSKIQAQLSVISDLGLGHLSLDRSAKTLRPSEIQRLRIANQLLTPLSDVLYVFDEPSIGLHPAENQKMINHFKKLVDKGNSVIVVEHNLDTIRSADHIIELGPDSGEHGGRVVFNGAFEDFIKSADLKSSLTLNALKESNDLIVPNKAAVVDCSWINLTGCNNRNLKNIDVVFKLGQLNVVTGKSGSGKSSLVKGTLLKAIEGNLSESSTEEPNCKKAEGLDGIDKLILIDHAPIGKTPRSNPATYLGISDHIRDLFASLPEAKSAGFTKSRFSFNNKGGRCETCQGAGKTQIGMHFLGNIDLICGSCNGKRFNPKTLEIKYNGCSISDVYKLSVNEAIEFFSADKKILSGLKILDEIGLGYLRLGQSSTTLSGGEAQRIKIANQLQKKDTGSTLYTIIEPSIGLHHSDVKSLLKLFDRIKEKGNTIVCIEQNAHIIAKSDWHIKLGPDGGHLGGDLIYQGIPIPITKENLSEPLDSNIIGRSKSNTIQLNGVATNGLKNLDVKIPKEKLTVVTGLSGSGKSSLVYDTLYAESNSRFNESLSTYNRSFLKQQNKAKLDSFSGLGPTIGINRRKGTTSKRSTVATKSGIYDAFRLLYSRISQHQGRSYTAQHFSFNHHLGACENCAGLGYNLTCNPEEIIINPNLSILEGAISKNKSIAYYSDLNGQFMATLAEVAKVHELSLDIPWGELSKEAQDIILFGTGDEIWDVTWSFKTKTKSGVQELQAKWLGFSNYINEEYERKLHNKNIKSLQDLLHEETCEVCKGSRLKPDLLTIKFNGKNIHDLTKMDITSCHDFINDLDSIQYETIRLIAEKTLASVQVTMETLMNLGLGYLTLDRSIASLSGGENQRVMLASQLSANLFGVTYVLDEPTIGLDSVQITSLRKLLDAIVQKGNTVVVIEHDAQFIESADHLIELGPGAGIYGGEIIYQGTVSGLKDAANSITRKLLNDKPGKIQKVVNTAGVLFGVTGVNANNLKGFDLELNSGQMIGVNGVSGSGKSSLIKDVVFQSFKRKKPVNCDSVFGIDQFEEVLMIDQEPLPERRLNTPVSHSGVIDDLKGVYAKTQQAKILGLKKTDFSYQSKNGKCKSCNGYGQLKTSMDFMSDFWLECDICNGSRFNQHVLSVKFNYKSIGEVLTMSIAESFTFFKEDVIADKLNLLISLGLGHLKLGQSGDSLSGGEAQRLKLAAAILKKGTGNKLFLFDEPSTGLHYFDIEKLTQVFQSLVKKGDTIIFIEHNKQMLAHADQIITLGPGSGDKGGALVKNT